MSNGWKTVKFGKFLRPNKRPYTLGDSEDANLVGMRLYGGGPFHRELKPAMQIAKKTHFVIKTGDVIFNKLFAWKGTFGIVPPELDGMFVSDKFPTYELDQTQAHPSWLQWYFQCPPLWEQAQSMSTGSAALSMLTLNPPKFLLLEIPLPPLSEQQRVVARIEELSAQIHEARTHRQQATAEADSLLRSIITHDDHSVLTPLRELVSLRTPDVVVRAEELYQFAGVYCFGRGVFKATRKSGLDFAYPRLTRLRAGNFVYPKLMAWEGAFGVVPPECDDCVVSTEFPVFEVNEDRVVHEVLDIYFRTPSVWQDVAGASTGTNVRRRRLNPESFLNYAIPLPSRATQLKVRKVMAEVDALKRLQAATSAELDALLPAILDRAFKGEL
jgi:type I restriction enzyme S subunit